MSNLYNNLEGLIFRYLHRCRNPLLKSLFRWSALQPTYFVTLLWLSGLTVFLSSCTAPPPTPSPPTPPTLAPAVPTDDPNLAVLQLTEVTVSLSPAGATATVSGQMSDPCLKLQLQEQTRQGIYLQVQVVGGRVDNQSCPAAQLQPFRQQIPLDLTGLADGVYVLTVNEEVSASFTYEQRLMAGIAPNAISISGQVWHDVCDNQNGGEGCTDGAVGNGQLDEGESGLALVALTLGRGPCPSDNQLNELYTEQDGSYLFSNLPAGTYCLSINSESDYNRLLLSPGQWRFPTSAAGQTMAYETISQNRTELNFGWDYENLPRPEGDLACTDEAFFVEDLSQIRSMTPGTALTQRWKIQNVGTCTWTTEYKLVWASGYLISSRSIELPAVVAPGETVELSLAIYAPESGGNISSGWLLQNPAGRQFGLGVLGNRALSVNFYVPVPATATPEVTPTPEA